MSTVKLEHITINQLKPYIYTAFRDDVKLKEYHICPGTYREMTMHNYNNILDHSNEYAMKCYKVVKDEAQDIGFAVIIEKPVPVLLSFGISIMNRTKDVLLQWLDELRKIFNNDSFGVGLWSKNTRAINFFLRNGFEIGQESSVDNKNFIVLWQL